MDIKSAERESQGVVGGGVASPPRTPQPGPSPPGWARIARASSTPDAACGLFSYQDLAIEFFAMTPEAINDLAACSGGGTGGECSDANLASLAQIASRGSQCTHIQQRNTAPAAMRRFDWRIPCKHRLSPIPTASAMSSSPTEPKRPPALRRNRLSQRRHPDRSPSIRTRA